jgi:hypothetical protein
MSSTGDSTEHKVSTAATPPYSQQNKPREIGTTFNPPPPEKSVASSTHVAFSRATFTTPHAPFTRLVSPPSTPTPSSEPPFLSPTKTTTTSEAPPPSTQKATTFERFSPPQPPKTPVATNQTEVSELLKQLSLLLPKLKPEVISKLSPSVFNPTPKPEIVEAETMETTTYTTTSVLPSTHTQEPSKREAPVFSAEQLRINISEVGKVSLPAMEAKYLDGKKGPIGYVLEAGDTSLFRFQIIINTYLFIIISRVNSTTGELEVLRSLNAETQKVHHLRIGTEQANDAVNYARSSNVAFYSYNLTVVVVDVKEWTPRFDRDKYEFTFDVATKPHGEPIGKVVQDQVNL